MKDVFVVGAGMSGIVCALALVPRGVSTIVLDPCSKDQWSERIKAAASELPNSTPFDELLDIRFDFAVDRICRIDGSDVLVAWSGDSPVIARRGFLAVGAASGEVLVPLQSYRPPAGIPSIHSRLSHSDATELSLYAEWATADGDPVSAWKHGWGVSSGEKPRMPALLC